MMTLKPLKKVKVLFSLCWKKPEKCQPPNTELLHGTIK